MQHRLSPWISILLTPLFHDFTSALDAFSRSYPQQKVIQESPSVLLRAEKPQTLTRTAGK